MSYLHKIYLIVRYLGPTWLCFRIYYFLKLKSGFLKWRCPIKTWDSYDVFIGKRKPLKKYPGSNCNFLYSEHIKEKILQKGDNCLHSEFTYFSGYKVKHRQIPDWFLNPNTGKSISSLCHWSMINDFAFGDIKLIWEINRFSWAFDLARSYHISKDIGYVERFWELYSDWLEKNPPNVGINWKCGQELALRYIAVSFAISVFSKQEGLSEERLLSFHRLSIATAERIYANIDYAISQRNNHGTSEAAVLLVIATLYSELTEAKSWKKKAEESLDFLMNELFYDDGSFSQYSLNYQRVAVDSLVWACSTLRMNEGSFKSEWEDKLRDSAVFMSAFVNSETGLSPCYGSNDGARILQLAECDYFDFRPSIQSVHILLDGKRAYTNGEWDEASYWLLPKSNKIPVDYVSLPTELNAEETGYYIRNYSDWFAFFRAGKHLHRPGQADMLHVDVLLNGKEITCDPGSFSYNAKAPMDHAFKPAFYHNTVTVDGKDQMRKFSRFLYLPWIHADCEAYDRHSITARHLGYSGSGDTVEHKRTLNFSNEKIRVTDQLNSDSSHSYTLHWMFAETDYSWDSDERRLSFPKLDCEVYFITNIEEIDISMQVADKNSSYGWRSRIYNKLEASLSVKLITQYSETAEIVTEFRKK